MKNPAIVIAESDTAARAIAEAIKGRIDTDVEDGDGIGSMLSVARSCMAVEDRRTVVIVEALSADDRFFRMWLNDAQYLLQMAGDGVIIAAAPDLTTALADDEWIARLAEAVG